MKKVRKEKHLGWCDIMDFGEEYYDRLYFADLKGKEYRNPNGSIGHWGYQNPMAEWVGAGFIATSWKNIFKLNKCNTDSGLCKALDVGCGRGTFVAYLRDVGVECWGFDFSEFAIKNPYPRCQKGWCIKHDATVIWPYGDKAFDLVLALDIMEHLFEPDIDFVIDELYRVSKKYVFLQIAVCGSGGLQGNSGFNGYILKKGDKVPIEFESMVVAGHVTVQSRQFWIDKLLKNKEGVERKWRVRDDMVLDFIGKVPAAVIDNWLKNAMIVMEKV